MKIVIIIPTYNEEGGVGAILDELTIVCTTLPAHEWIILIVDGNSTDATCAVVEKKSAQYNYIHLLKEERKSGIAQAYIKGIRHALDTFTPDVFVEFDGDGQHDPQYLVPMVRALEAGADHVIGSRYVPGGSIPTNWALYRKLLSRFGSLYARLLLELPVHDVTSGFKMTRVVPFASRLPLTQESLISSQYAYKIQFLTVMHDSGARITEVPIRFRERENDVSKSSTRDIIESLRVTAHLRVMHIRRWRLLRVLAIGSLGFLLQALIFELLGIRYALLLPSIAAVVGGECAILSNFLLNEKFAFRDQSNKAISSPFQRLLRFHLVSSGSILLQWLSIRVTEHFTSSPPILRTTFLLSVMCGFLINYAGYYFYVWRTHSTYADANGEGSLLQNASSQ